MSADPVGDAVDARPLAKVNRKPTRTLERRRIELQPARLACARQPPVGDDNVRRGAGARNGRPINPVGRTGREQAPFRAALAQHRNTRIMRAVAGRLPLKEVGIAVEAGGFRKQAAHIIAGTVPQEQRHSILDNRQMPSVAGHEQVG